MSDKLVKATAEGVRVYAAITTDLVNEAIRRHSCSPVAAAALGRTMTGALLLAANMKNKEAITVKFAGDGPIGRVTADATPEGAVRGYVTNPQVNLPLRADGKLDVGRAIGKGMLTVVRFTGLKEPVSGSVELTTGEVGDDLTRYLYLSEQTPSSVGVGVLVGTDLKAEAAGGFFIQPLPDATDEVISRLEENLKDVKSVTSMIKEGLDAKGIIARLLQGFEVNYLTTTDLSFRCHCSKRKIEDTFMSLNQADLDSLAADGHAEVCCQFCGEKYQFSAVELQALAGAARKWREMKNKKQ